QNSDDSSEEPDEWSSGPDGRQTSETAFEFSMDDGSRPLQRALAGFYLFTRNFAGFAMRAELLQAGSDNLRQVRLLVALGDADRFVNLSLAQSSGYGRSKGARLLASGAIGDIAVNHYADRPGRHDKQDNDHQACRPAHLPPKRDRVPLDFTLLKEHGEYGQLVIGR